MQLAVAQATASLPRSVPGLLTTTIVTGEAASRLLRDQSFRDEWAVLHAACPWATVCQGLAFSDAWWSVYDGAYEPLIVQCRAEDEALVGLLLLARAAGSSEVVHVGAHQAEYHTWLAVPAFSDEVITNALRELEAQGVAQRLQFHFLAPDSPISWIGAYEGSLSPRCLVGMHRRGTLRFTSSAARHESLRKPANRSKLNRLARGGDVSLQLLANAADLEKWLPEIVAMCDARQGAVHESMPFRDDPRKQAFCLALARHEGLTHVSILVAGNELLAAHIGLINDKQVLLGLIAHAPQHGRHSPGKLLLLMLAQRLETDGYHAFDLTPGGAYKERFATDFDVVHSLDVRFLAREAVVQNARRKAGMLARIVIPASTKRTTPRVGALSSGSKVFLLDRIADADFFEDCQRAVDEAAAHFRVRANHINDLMLFGGPDVQRPSLLRFLSDAISRLEAGSTMVSVTDAHSLVYLNWVKLLRLDTNSLDDTRSEQDLLLIENGVSTTFTTEQGAAAAIAAGILALAPEPQFTIAAMLRDDHLFNLSATALRRFGFRDLSSGETARWTRRLASA